MNDEENKIQNEKDNKKKKRLIFIIIGAVIAVALVIILSITLTTCSKNGNSQASYTYGKPTYAWTEDYSSCTAERICNEDSKYNETETVDSIYKITTPASYDADGVGTYVATFKNKNFEEQTVNIVLEKLIYHGQTPILSSDGKTLTYGLYPQTNVNDSSLVSTLNSLTTPESNGWYLYDNEYYAKVSANPFISGYKFDNGTTIVSGTTYWFKCEPITWNVLSNNDGKYYILSTILLDNCDYAPSNNNYANSTIRSWLNGDFYNSAFSLGDSNILKTTVDNSASTTNSSDNENACENTEDYVFLPSYKDYINSSYGFSTSTSKTDTRTCKTTDWARAKRAYCNMTDSSCLYNGKYYTRSPYDGGSGNAWHITYNGSIDLGTVNGGTYCVRPALMINIA